MSGVDEGGEAASGTDSGAGEAIDFGARELCLDGACTGVIGDDGRCRVCGLPGPAPVAPGGDGAGRSEGDEGLPAAAFDAAPDPGPALPGAEADDELDLSARELCPDGACTGVLGDDGRCRVCGRDAAGELAVE